MYRELELGRTKQSLGGLFVLGISVKSMNLWSQYIISLLVIHQNFKECMVFLKFKGENLFYRQLKTREHIQTGELGDIQITFSLPLLYISKVINVNNIKLLYQINVFTQILLYLSSQELLETTFHIFKPNLPLVQHSPLYFLLVFSGSVWQENTGTQQQHVSQSAKMQKHAAHSNHASKERFTKTRS